MLDPNHHGPEWYPPSILPPADNRSGQRREETLNFIAQHLEGLKQGRPEKALAMIRFLALEAWEPATLFRDQTTVLELIENTAATREFAADFEALQAYPTQFHQALTPMTPQTTSSGALAPIDPSSPVPLVTVLARFTELHEQVKQVE